MTDASKYGPTEATPTARASSARVGRACAVLAQAREQLARVEADCRELPGGAGDVLSLVASWRATDISSVISNLQLEQERFARATGVRTRTVKEREGE